DVVAVPVVLGEDRVGVLGDLLVAGKREAGQRAGGAVRAVTHRGRGARAATEGEVGAARVDAAGVGDDDLLTDGRDRLRVVVRRQQADEAHRLLRVAVVLVDGDGVRAAERHEQVAVSGHRDAARLVADLRRGPRPGLDRLHDLVLGRVDHRDGVVV